MSYAPGVAYDPSPIYQGLSNLASGLVAGITAKRRKEEEAAQQKQALGFIRQMAPQFSPELAQLDDKSLLEGIKSVGADNVVNLAQGITAAGQRKAAADLQREQMQQALAAARAAQSRIGTNRTALAAAANSADAGGDPTRSYLAAGGDDPSQMDELNAMATRMAKGNRAEPSLRNFGNDASGRPVEGLVDAQGNVKYIEPPKSAKDELMPLEIGGKKLFVGPGNRYFDEAGAPLAFPANIDPAMMAWLGDFFNRDKGKPATEAEIPTVTPAEAAKLPKGTRFKTTDGRTLVKN